MNSIRRMFAPIAFAFAFAAFALVPSVAHAQGMRILKDARHLDRAGGRSRLPLLRARRADRFRHEGGARVRRGPRVRLEVTLPEGGRRAGRVLPLGSAGAGDLRHHGLQDAF